MWWKDVILFREEPITFVLPIQVCALIGAILGLILKRLTFENQLTNLNCQTICKYSSVL